MRVSAIIRRILQQMRRDRRTMALIFIAPLFVLSLMYFIFNGEDINPKLGVVNVDKEIVTALKDADITVTKLTKADNNAIIEKNLDGMLVQKDDKFTLTLTNTDPNLSKGLEIRVKENISLEMIGELIDTLSRGRVDFEDEELDMDVKYIYGDEDTTSFDTFSPALIGFFVFFFVFLISGIGLLRERMTGTMEKLMSTPVNRWEVVAGYLIGYGIIAMVQTTVTVLFAIKVLDIVLVGSIWNVLIICGMSAIVALSLGILLSAFATSEFQMIQFIPIVIIPQAFFCGLFPLEGMAAWLQAIAKIMPMYYSADALKAIMYKGFGLGDVKRDMLVLAGFAVVFIVLNVAALKRYRKL